MSADRVPKAERALAIAIKLDQQAVYIAHLLDNLYQLTFEMHVARDVCGILGEAGLAEDFLRNLERSRQGEPIDSIEARLRAAVKNLPAKKTEPQRYSRRRPVPSIFQRAL